MPTGLPKPPSPFVDRAFYLPTSSWFVVGTDLLALPRPGPSPSDRAIHPPVIMGCMALATHREPTTRASTHAVPTHTEPIHAVPTLSLIHISEPTRLGMISYAVFCLKKKT